MRQTLPLMRATACRSQVNDMLSRIDGSPSGAVTRSLPNQVSNHVPKSLRARSENVAKGGRQRADRLPRETDRGSSSDRFGCQPALRGSSTTKCIQQSLSSKDLVDSPKLIPIQAQLRTHHLDNCRC